MLSDECLASLLVNVNRARPNDLSRVADLPQDLMARARLGNSFRASPVLYCCRSGLEMVLDQSGTGLGLVLDHSWAGLG